MKNSPKFSNVGSVKRFVFNDVHARSPIAYCEIDTEEFTVAFKASVEFPFDLSKRMYAKLRTAHTGHIVFITSARQLQPEQGVSVATSVSNAATSLALSLAREAAECNIQVNVVQPNYLYSELYSPKATNINTAAGREEIRQQVPVGCLGQPEELAELVELFVSGGGAFTTRQVLNFTGGWSCIVDTKKPVVACLFQFNLTLG